MFVRCSSFILLIIILITVTSVSCKNYICSDRLILMTFVGYSLNDIDTLVIRRYESKSNFSNLIDTFPITNKALNNGKGYGIYTSSNDTTIVFVNGNYPNNGIFPGYDWKIFLPANGKIISISNIIGEKKEGGQKCENPINSFQVETTIQNEPTFFQTQDYSTTGYRAYILP
jgi:hypothetical protein